MFELAPKKPIMSKFIKAAFSQFLALSFMHISINRFHPNKNYQKTLDFHY